MELGLLKTFVRMTHMSPRLLDMKTPIRMTNFPPRFHHHASYIGINLEDEVQLKFKFQCLNQFILGNKHDSTYSIGLGPIDCKSSCRQDIVCQMNQKYLAVLDWRMRIMTFDIVVKPKSNYDFQVRASYRLQIQSCLVCKLVTLKYCNQSHFQDTQTDRKHKH